MLVPKVIAIIRFVCRKYIQVKSLLDLNFLYKKCLLLFNLHRQSFVYFKSMRKLSLYCWQWLMKIQTKIDIGEYLIAPVPQTRSHVWNHGEVTFPEIGSIFVQPEEKVSQIQVDIISTKVFFFSQVSKASLTNPRCSFNFNYF